jgi:hypothetical protein
MSRRTGYLRERFVSSTKLPYQLAPDKTTLKLPGIQLKLPYQLVPCQLDMIGDPNKST